MIRNKKKPFMNSFWIFAADIFLAFLFVRNIKKIGENLTEFQTQTAILYSTIPFHHHGSLTFEKYYYYVPPKFVGFRSKHLRSKDKRGFIGRVTNCQKDKNHNSWNFYNRSKVIPVTWQSIVCSASKKFFHSRQMGQWELISNFPIFQHQYQLLEVHT